MPEPTTSTSTIVQEGEPSGDLVRADSAGDPARVAFWLGLLGIPTFGLTALAGIGVGLFSLRGTHRWRTAVATLWCFVVLATWLGGLVGALEMMRAAQGEPQSIIAAGGRLGDALAGRIVRGVDPEDPQSPGPEALARLVDQMPLGLRRHAEGSTLLAVEPLVAESGIFLRWRIGVPVDPEAEASVTRVREDRSGVHSFAVDGRQIWSFRRLAGSDGDRLDDRSRMIVDATLPAARLIVAQTQARNGELPSPTEAATLLRDAGFDPTPTYRVRPGELFDLFVPETRSYATYAAFGGILFPVES